MSGHLFWKIERSCAKVDFSTEKSNTSKTSVGRSLFIFWEWLNQRGIFFEMLRYGLIGAIVFVFDMGALAGLSYGIHVQLQAAVSLAYFFSVLVHFTLNKLWNFKSFSRRTRQQIRTYAFTVIFNYFTTLLFMNFFVLHLHWNLLVAKIITVILNALWGFPAQKYLTFAHGIRVAVNKIVGRIGHYQG